MFIDDLEYSLNKDNKINLNIALKNEVSTIDGYFDQQQNIIKIKANKKIKPII